MQSVELDPQLLVQQLNAKIATLESDRQRRMIVVYRDHMLGELAGDLTAVMNTLVPEPEYHGWGPLGDAGPKGSGAVKDFYTEWFDLKGNYFEMDIHRIVVDDENLVTELTQRMIISGGSFLAGRWGRGVEASGGSISEEFDPSGHYLLASRSILVLPFDEHCRMKGEDGYGGGGRTMRRVDDDELPPAYVALVAS